MWLPVEVVPQGSKEIVEVGEFVTQSLGHFDRAMECLGLFVRGGIALLLQSQLLLQHADGLVDLICLRQ